MSIVGETPLLHHTYSTSHEVKTYLPINHSQTPLPTRASEIRENNFTLWLFVSSEFWTKSWQAEPCSQQPTYPARRIVSPSRIPHPVSQPKTKSSKTYKTPPPLRPPSTASGPLVPASTYLPLVTEVRGQKSTMCYVLYTCRGIHHTTKVKANTGHRYNGGKALLTPTRYM